MPRTPIDYAKTIIYKLVHKDDLNDENIYTGHTTEMTKRKTAHKSNCTNPNSDKYNQKNYKYIRDNGGWDEWLMIEIEKYPCKDKPEAVARERVIQTEMKAKLNTEIAGRTKKEWKIDNRDKLLERQKQYERDNREKIAEKSKKYRQDNREKIKEQKKKYHEDNREKRKQYRQYNREKISENAKQKITCDHCGSILRYNNIARHKKSQKCINFKPA
jgi:hypothetical protein